MTQDYQSKNVAINKPKIGKNTLIFLIISVFFDLLSVGIIAPVIPYIVVQFKQDALVLGLLALSFSGAQFIATPALGLLSDRYGRRPFLILSLIGTGIGYFIFGFANSLWLIFIARLIDGFTGGNISIAQAYVADVTPVQDRAKNFGLIGAALGSGFILGPALGGWLSQISLQTPVFVAGILSAITIAFGLFILPESLPPKRRRKTPIAFKELNPVKQIADALRQLTLRRFLLANFITTFAFGGLQTTFALFTLQRFSLGADQNGLLFTYMGISSVLVLGLISTDLVKKFGEQRLALFGSILMTVGFAGVTLVPEVWMLYPPVGLIAGGSSISSTTLTSIVSKRVSKDKQGLILGASQALESLALIIGPVWGGITFEYFGADSSYWMSAGWIAISALLIVKIL